MAVVPFPGIIGRVSGVAGERFTTAEVAASWGVPRTTVVSWIERGLLVAAWTRHGGYRIRLKALRRALMDHPEVAEAVLRPKLKRAKQQSA